MCASVSVMTFPWSARARFSNHKHELMDPIMLWRYVCLLSTVKSKERREIEADACTQAYPSVDTGTKIPTTLLGHYCQCFHFI